MINHLTPPSLYTKQATAHPTSKQRTIAMIYSLIKRIPGSQGTKVCRVVRHVV